MIADGFCPISDDIIRSANWMGSVPVVLTLAPTSLSSPTIPPPIHVMLPRNTYLHVGLRSAIFRLYKFAPSILNFSSGLVRRIEAEQTTQLSDNDEDGNRNDSNGRSNKDKEKNKKEQDGRDSKTKKDKNDKTSEMISSNIDNDSGAEYPVCWLEDEESHIPLRWHLFVGVLYDMRKATPPPLQHQRHRVNNNSQSSLQEQQKKELPWKIRLHFSSYPSSQILPLERNLVWTSMERTYKNSLKQALFLQYGNSKVAMNMTKQSHERLWDSIVTTNYPLYQQINVGLQKSKRNKEGEPPDLLPVRLFLNSKPPIQRPCRIKNNSGDNALLTIGSLFMQWIPEYFQQKLDEEEWQINDSDNDTTTNRPKEIEPKSESIRWLVCGITPPLSTPILDLWRNLCHPDHFLISKILLYAVFALTTQEFANNFTEFLRRLLLFFRQVCQEICSNFLSNPP